MNKPAGKFSSSQAHLNIAGGSEVQDTGSGGASNNAAAKPIIIKKYANRRLYNTETSSYVTLEDLGEMVRSERDFYVYDAKTGEDLTHAVLTQIIVEEEGKSGQNLLPIGFLRLLIRFYGHSLEHLVPKYLELSLETLAREQEKYHQQLASALSSNAFEALQEQARQNMAMFERALSMFSPFAMLEGPKAQSTQPGPAPSDPAETASSSEIAALKAELNEMKARLDRLSKAQTAAEQTDAGEHQGPPETEK